MVLNSMSYTKVVNGQKIEMSETEIAEFEAMQPSTQDLLDKAIANKLVELDTYHYDSDDIRQLSVNGVFEVSLNKVSRDIIVEQISNLEMKIGLGLNTIEDSIFTYYYEGGNIEITLNQLKGLYTTMLNIVNENFKVYTSHITTIKSLTSIEDIEVYDFTINYIKNQAINV
jgi:hypothetical protein